MQTFETWLQPTHEISLDGDRLRVGVPNRRFAEWIGTNFHPLIEQALDSLGSSNVQIQYVAEDRDADGSPPAAADDGAANLPPGLSRRYTFDSFVVSSCNQFAQRVAVASCPQKVLPAHIYGGQFGKNPPASRRRQQG
jgi:chromosomal replication initiator protein